MKKYSGFTLIELMVAVAIGGILLAVALPNYNSMIKNNCLTTTTNNLVTGFQIARSEAIKQRREITIGTTTDWASSWAVYQDANNDDSYDAGEEIRINAQSCGVGTVTVTEAGGDNDFGYRSDGFIDAAGTFKFCDDRAGPNGRQVEISNTGRVSTTSGTTCP